MKFSTTQPARPIAAFTMMEIAICLAIIGFALVAIIGVLPIGLNTQRDNREETIINQEATVLLEAIRSGSRGADDLTNYVYAIAVTNKAGVNIGYINQTLAGQMNFSKAITFPTVNQWYSTLTSGARIIGLLSTPEYTDKNGNAVYDPNLAVYTNYVRACVRSISGLAAEKPPQQNDIMVGDSFAYQLYCVNAPIPTTGALTGFAKQLAANQHELRLTFLWPQLPNGNLGSGRQTFRTLVAGQLVQTNLNYFYYQSQSFTNVP